MRDRGYRNGSPKHNTSRKNISFNATKRSPSQARPIPSLLGLRGSPPLHPIHKEFSMRPYSNDLRIRVINAYKNGEGSQRELARRFCVCLATVQNWLKRFRDTGHLQPKDYRRGPQPRIDQRSLMTLRQIVANKPEATLEALCEDFYSCAKVRVSKPTMCRALQKLRDQESPHNRMLITPERTPSPGISA